MEISLAICVVANTIGVIAIVMWGATIKISRKNKLLGEVIKDCSLMTICMAFSVVATVKLLEGYYVFGGVMYVCAVGDLLLAIFSIFSIYEAIQETSPDKIEKILFPK